MENAGLGLKMPSTSPFLLCPGLQKRKFVEANQKKHGAVQEALAQELEDKRQHVQVFNVEHSQLGVHVTQTYH